MDKMNSGSAWLARQMKKHASKSVRYSRDAAYVDVAATLGKTEFEVIGDDEGITRVWTRDFIVSTNDLKLNDTAILPQSGDRITETTAAGTEVYRVAAPNDETPWQYAGQHKHQIRIHTQRIT